MVMSSLRIQSIFFLLVNPYLYEQQFLRFLLHSLQVSSPFKSNAFSHQHFNDAFLLENLTNMFHTRLLLSICKIFFNYYITLSCAINIVFFLSFITLLAHHTSGALGSRTTSSLSLLHMSNTSYLPPFGFFEQSLSNHSVLLN